MKAGGADSPLGGDEPVIVALGASTAVGRDAWSSAAAVRAGVAGLSEHPQWVDRVGEPLRCAVASWLDAGEAPAERLRALLLPAVEQALLPLASLKARVQVDLALGLPAPRSWLPADLPAAMTQEVQRCFGGVFSACATFRGGHTSALLALQAALLRLRAGTATVCVVAGVDSWIDADALHALEAQAQLHGAGALNNAWGFTPGEGAGALLLTTARFAQANRLPTLARLLGVGIGHESKLIRTDAVCTGEGLTAAFADALAALPVGGRISDIYCDLNGEPYRSDEYGFTAVRSAEHFEGGVDFVAPADCWGDVGAAAGALGVALAAAAGFKGYARGGLALAWGSAEGGERAAALLATAPAGS